MQEALLCVPLIRQFKHKTLVIEKRIGELVCRNKYDVNVVFLDSLPLWSTWNYQMLQIFIVLPSFHGLHFNFIKRWGAGNNWLVKKVVWNQQFSYHYKPPLITTPTLVVIHKYCMCNFQILTIPTELQMDVEP